MEMFWWALMWVEVEAEKVRLSAEIGKVLEMVGKKQYRRRR